MTEPDLVTRAEAAALFGVNPGTITRWADQGALSSVRTLGGHRRYRAAEIHARLNGKRSPGPSAPVQTLVDDHYDGDPVRALRDLARLYGLAVAVLDRTRFTKVTGNGLTDAEWQLLTAELAEPGSSLRVACADHLARCAAAALSTAGAEVEQVPGSAPAPPLPAAAAAALLAARTPHALGGRQ